MIIGGIYSVKNGYEVMKSQYEEELGEILEVIQSIDAEKFITKKSKEKTRKRGMLYSPVGLNKAIKEGFKRTAWSNLRVKADYSVDYYVEEYRERIEIRGAFRDMDFVKNKVGVEVQFGKYSFMVYNVSAKMTIFHKLGAIDVGVEIVPLKSLAQRMSSGVSYFEQFVWDLENRGVSDIDIPVLILGITSPALLTPPPVPFLSP